MEVLRLLNEPSIQCLVQQARLRALPKLLQCPLTALPAMMAALTPVVRMIHVVHLFGEKIIARISTCTECIDADALLAHIQSHMRRPSRHPRAYVRVAGRAGCTSRHCNGGVFVLYLLCCVGRHSTEWYTWSGR